MNQIAALLTLQKVTRDAQTVEDFGFIISNETQKIVPVKQIIFWIYRRNKIDFISVSGGKTLDPNGPYTLALKDYLKQQINHITDGTIRSIEKNQSDKSIDATSDILLTHHHYLLPFYSQKDGVIGGLWIDHDEQLSEGAKDVFNDLGDHYTQCLSLLNYQISGGKQTNQSKSSKLRFWATIISVILFLFPVRLSITAPAEIVAQNPIIVTAPFDGIIKEIAVRPGDDIAQEDLLVVMDDIKLRAQFETAEQDLKATKSALSRAGLESLKTEERKADLQKLRGDIETKTIELKHTQTLLGQSNIKATADGVAIFSDPSALKGKPIRAGENIMMIADPNKKELLIRVPSQNIIPINDNQDISFFMNTAPLSSLAATITTMGYQASQDPDGLLTYKIRAQIDADEDLRIGWKGTAKIKSNWSILGYAILRRPLIALRNIMGV